jgi:hypothetical protein
MGSVLLVSMLSQPRVFLAMSRDGLLPPFFSEVHSRFGTPWKAQLLTGIVVALIGSLIPLTILVEFVSIGTLMAFLFVCICVPILRHTRPDLPRPFRCPWVPLVPILGALMCLALMLSLPATNWYRLLGWFGVGLIIYFVYGRRHGAGDQHRILTAADVARTIAEEMEAAVEDHDEAALATLGQLHAQHQNDEEEEEEQQPEKDEGAGAADDKDDGSHLGPVMIMQSKNSFSNGMDELVPRPSISITNKHEVASAIQSQDRDAAATDPIRPAPAPQSEVELAALTLAAAAAVPPPESVQSGWRTGQWPVSPATDAALQARRSQVTEEDGALPPIIVTEGAPISSSAELASSTGVGGLLPPVHECASGRPSALSTSSSFLPVPRPAAFSFASGSSVSEHFDGDLSGRIDRAPTLPAPAAPRPSPPAREVESEAQRREREEIEEALRATRKHMYSVP